jgi:hypothetical protein
MFGYVLTSYNTSTDAITNLAIGNLQGLTTSVAAGDNNATYPQSTFTPPTSAQRTVSGKTITFNYLGSPGLGTIVPGATSRIAYIYTDARSYTQSSAGILDGIATNAAVYAPAPAPEPTSFAGMALGAAVLLRRRRQER